MYGSRLLRVRGSLGKIETWARETERYPALAFASAFSMNIFAFPVPSHPEWALIRIQVDPTAPSSAMVRPPLHLCVVLDVSASMDDEGRLENVKHSLHHLLGLLTPTDRMSLITFSRTATTVLRQAFLDDVEALRMTLSCLQTESNTNIGAGLMEAERVLFRDREQTQCVLLLTDGCATSGVMEAEALLALARPLADHSVLHVIGYGESHQADLLSQMATVGGGSYHVVCHREDVAVVIGDVVGGLVSCAFQQVMLTLPVCEVKTRYRVTRETDADTASMMAATADTASMNIMIGDLMEQGEAIVLARMPIGSSFHVDAFHCATRAMDTTWAMVYATEEPRLHAMGAAHWLRWEVVTIMEAVAEHVETFGSMHSLARAAHEHRITECLTAIRETRVRCSDYEAALWDLLTHELAICQDMLGGGVSSVHLRQHGATLSMMRGISSRMDSVNSIPAALPLSRAFSNATQRSWSEQMSQVGTQTHPSSMELPPLSLTRVPAHARAYATSVNPWVGTQAHASQTHPSPMGTQVYASQTHPSPIETHAYASQTHPSPMGTQVYASHTHPSPMETPPLSHETSVNPWQETQDMM